MNKTLCIIFIFIFTHHVKGQNSLNLKFIPLPNKTYNTQTIQELSNNGKLESSPSSPRKIEITSSLQKI